MGLPHSVLGSRKVRLKVINLGYDLAQLGDRPFFVAHLQLGLDLFLGQHIILLSLKQRGAVAAAERRAAVRRPDRDRSRFDRHGIATKTTTSRWSWATATAMDHSLSVGHSPPRHSGDPSFSG